jgi:hypothetical protein
METTLSFSDAMARLSETLYSAAKVHVNTRRTGRLTAPKLNADAWEYLNFDLKVDAQGKVNTQVEKYCAGYTLRCTAWIETGDPQVLITGSLLSSDGGGIQFGEVRSGQPIEFELHTSLWHSTRFSVNLKTSPGLPAGAILKVLMRIRY